MKFIQNLSKTRKKIIEKQNKGIEERMKRDIQASKSVEDNKVIMEKKTQLYDALKKGNLKTEKEYLVDFQQKKYESQTGEEKQQFEEEKERFYEEQKKIKEEREQNILSRKVGGGLNQQIDQVDSERLIWEAEALKEIEEGITEESNSKIDNC